MSPAPESEFDDFVAPTKIHWIGDTPATIHLRQCKLVTTVAGKPREHGFNQAEITIGSMTDNDLVVSDDTVSRHHCKIVQEDTGYVLVDLGSTNGTFINRVRVREAFLKPGCTIGLGKAEVKFLASDEELEVVPSRKERLGAAIGRSRKMRELFAIVEKIAPTGTTVIIEGETGTGKEIIAQEIHRLSSRASGPLMVFDCGAVPPNLIESELFGHEKGAFTGAVMTRQGLFEMAHGGTLFLDELGELPLDLQPKLLRALEQREIRRVGANRSIRVDVRIVAATNRDLEAEVHAGRFRQDLFYRLSVVRLRIPPMRDRLEDLPLLVKHFLSGLTANKRDDGSDRIRSVSREANDLLLAYPWPGNVRELLNVIERAVSLAEGDVLEAPDLPEVVRGDGGRAAAVPGRLVTAPVSVGAAGGDPSDSTFKEAKERLVSSFEREYIVSLLKKTGGNISQAAREADIDRKYFRKLMKKYDLAGADAGDDD
jgi:transcriptional regulator with GAF, ATPase, and Fis domain